MTKTLVVYYTHSQNTAKMAKIIAEVANADLVEIIPENAYPQNYNAVVNLAKQEISQNFRPKIKTDADVAKYDTIFVGTPNWWSTMAPPIATFLEAHDFAGKTVVPFATHGGGGFGHIERDIKNLAKGANTLQGLAEYGSSARKSDVVKWLERINLI